MILPRNYKAVSVKILPAISYGMNENKNILISVVKISVSLRMKQESSANGQCNQG